MPDHSQAALLPQVTAVHPASGVEVAAERAFTITFSGPMLDADAALTSSDGDIIPLEASWNRAHTKLALTFEKLPPGDYTLLMEAMVAADGTEIDDEVQVDFGVASKDC